MMYVQNEYQQATLIFYIGRPVYILAEYVIGTNVYTHPIQQRTFRNTEM